MKELVVAKRYARAIFELAVEGKELERVAGEMRKLAAVADALPAFLKGLSDERVDAAKRLAAVGKISAAMSLSRTTGNALKLLVAKGRAPILPFVAADFARRAERYAKLTSAMATVAESGVAAEVGRRLEKILSDALGTSARCDVSVDVALLGGFALQVGDVRYDASFKGKLDRMKEELL